MGYDTRCLDLAKHFMQDEPGLDNPTDTAELAQAIQDAVEVFFARKP